MPDLKIIIIIMNRFLMRVNFVFELSGYQKK